MSIDIGLIYPQTEIPHDPDSVRQFVSSAEALGYSHVVMYDHVLGADPTLHPGWKGAYDVDTTFHEPMVLFGFLAACSTLELVTGVLVAPQRQTALIAKQATEVDILTRGKFRLGLGVGWNAVEYEALGVDFKTRGERVDEQIGLLRRLWTEHSVTHDGQFEKVNGAGLSPAPIQRPIPIWVGGGSAPAYRRIGHYADGWFPLVAPGDRLTDAKHVIDAAAIAAGRDPALIGMEGRLDWRRDHEDTFVDHIGRWRAAGATKLGVNTMGGGLRSVEEHLDALERAATLLDMGK
jgi:probable F420-dependent oxidoreductase